MLLDRMTRMQEGKMNYNIRYFFARFHQHSYVRKFLTSTTLHIYKHCEACIVPQSLKKILPRGALPLHPAKGADPGPRRGLPRIPKCIRGLREDLTDCPGCAPGTLIRTLTTLTPTILALTWQRHYWETCIPLRFNHRALVHQGTWRDLATCSPTNQHLQ